MTDNIKDIFSRRLRQARLMKGFSLEKLSQSLKPAVSKQAISKYEKGLMMPDSSVLIALASALGVNIDYFFRPFTVDIDRVEFQKKSKFHERKSVAVKEKVREELERYLEIEQLCGCSKEFSMARKSVASSAEAVCYANHIRVDLGLGSDGISSVIEVLEDNGVKVIEIDEDENFEGLSGYANSSIPLIVVNGNSCAERKRFTALHELAHLLLDFPADADSKEIENICNSFASELLLPADVLISIVGKSRHDISIPELTDIQRRFGISIDDIMASLQANNVITVNRYAGYLNKKKKLTDFRELVEAPLYVADKSGRFMRMVFRALANDTISFSKAAMLLNTSVETVKSQLQFV